MTTVDELQVKFTADIAELQAAMDGISGQMDGLASHAESSLGGVGTLLAGLGLEEIGRRGVDSAVNLQDGLVKLGNESGATKEQVDAMRAGIEAMSRVVPQSVESITALAQASAKVGVGAPDVLSFTKTLLDFQAATGVAADTSAQAFHRLLITFHEGDDQAGVLASSIAGLSEKFHAPAQAVLDFASRISGTGTSIGLSKEQILAWSASLAGAGVESERGAQAVTNLFLKVQAAVQKGGQAAADMGVAQAKLTELQNAYNAAVANVPIAAQNALKASHEALQAAAKTTQQAEFDLADARQAGDKDAVKAAEEAVLTARKYEAAQRDSYEAVLDSTKAADAGSKEQIRNAETALKNQESLVSNMGKETKGLDAIATAAGMTGAAFRAAFEADPNGAITGLLQNLDKAKKGTPEYAAALVALGDSSGLAADTIGRAAEAASKMPEAVATAGDAVKNAADLQGKANAVYSDSASKLEIQKEKLAETGRTIGNDLLPAVLAISKAFGDFLDGLSAHPGALHAIEVGLLAIVGALVAMKIEALLAAIDFGILDAAMLPITLAILVLLAAIALVAYAIQHWGEFVAGLGVIHQNFVEGLHKGIDDIINAYTAVVHFFEGVGSSIKHVFGEVRDFIGQVWDAIVAGAKFAINLQLGFINGLIAGINFLIDALDTIHFTLPDWVPIIGGKSFGINIPHVPSIPLLDVGGVVTQTGLAVIHGGEVVVPAAKVDAYQDSNRGGGVTINGGVNLYTAETGEAGARDLFDAFMGRLRVAQFRG